MLPYGRQSISKEDIASVVRVLSSEFLTSGPEVDAFENEFAKIVGAKHAVAVSSATAALHLAMKVLGIGSGDRVVTSPNTFLASANAAAYVGATPDFSDIDSIFRNIDPVALERNWKPDTKAVVAVDYAGVPCNMPEIARIARKQGAYIIEDACHGVGGGFRTAGGQWKLGGHPWADITTFSFHPVKTMTTGEGGMLVTDNDEWAAKARLLRTHGVTRNPSDFVGLVEKNTYTSGFKSQLADVGPWYYEMQYLGYNYRITDIQSALGRSQLKRLPESILRRRKIAAYYNEALTHLDWLSNPVFKTGPSPTDSSKFHIGLSDLSLHLYTVQIDFAKLGKTRTEVMRCLHVKGVGTQVLYIPVYLQPWYRSSYGYYEGKCPRAEAFYCQALSLPLYHGMSDEDAQKVVTALTELAP